MGWWRRKRKRRAGWSEGSYRGGFARSTPARGWESVPPARERERRQSAPNMQQEKKNWRSIGSSW